MANQVYNNIQVRGSDQELKKFYDYVKTDMDNFDFNKIFPCNENGDEGN